MDAARFRATCGATAVGIALVALAGWSTGASHLTSVIAGWATIKPNTAIAVGALGIGLVARPLRLVGALVAGALATLALGEWASGLDPGLDVLLFADPASVAAGQPPGRMAAATALGLLGVAVALSTHRRWPATSQGFAGAALAIAWIALLGYACELRPLSSVWLYGSVSLPTAVALTVAATGALALEPQRGWLVTLTGEDGGAVLLRRLAPAALLLPSLTAWVVLRMERTWSWPLGFALAVAATLDASVFAALLASTAKAVRTRDRRLAELAHVTMQSQEAERRAIAHELHDEFGQTLTALQLLVVRSARHPEAADEAGVLLASLTDGVRRMSHQLRPAILDDLGLVAALRWLVRDWAVGVEVRVEGDRRTDADVELAAFRIVQEALTNVVRHAGATRIEVGVRFDEDTLTVAVTDDGGGIASVPTPGLGLLGMDERARAVGGRLHVGSDPSGTHIRAILPAPRRHP